MRETGGVIFFSSVAALYLSAILSIWFDYIWILSVVSIIGIIVGLTPEIMNSEKWNDGDGYGA